MPAQRVARKNRKDKSLLQQTFSRPSFPCRFLPLPFSSPNSPHRNVPPCPGTGGPCTRSWAAALRRRGWPWRRHRPADGLRPADRKRRGGGGVPPPRRQRRPPPPVASVAAAGHRLPLPLPPPLPLLLTLPLPPQPAGGHSPTTRPPRRVVAAEVGGSGGKRGGVQRTRPPAGSCWWCCASKREVFEVVCGRRLTKCIFNSSIKLDSSHPLHSSDQAPPVRRRWPHLLPLYG